MSRQRIKKIYIDPQAEQFSLAQNVRKNAGSIPVETIEQETLFERYSQENAIDSSKETIFVTCDKGSQLKRCPGTRGRICCNYHVVNQGIGCPFDCSYCFLQEFSNLPATFIYANCEDIFIEIKEKLAASPENFFRIGTGEMTDSLALDWLTNFSSMIVPFFNDLPNALLELKTKSKEVDALLSLPHGGNTIISWSLNPQQFIDSDELFTASLQERIEAAAKVAGAGYQLAFHFDPMVPLPNWEEQYLNMVSQLKKHIDPHLIRWISLGSFRYKPAMKKIMDFRFPHSALSSGEHLLCNDGKMRYFKKQRIAMYRLLSNALLEWHKNLFLYFCMEDTDIWEAVFHKNPQNTLTVDKLFRKSLHR